MIIDLGQLRNDPFADKQFDICIVGGGVVGISLALSLDPGLRVVLLEAGGIDYSAESMSVYEGESVGQDYFDLRASRLRYFGGSSNHWGGDCRPLDAYDFDAKDYVPHSGWPIAKSDIDPYLNAAESILDLDNDPWDAPDGYLEDKIANSTGFKPVRFKFSTPTRFGKKYRQALEKAENILCALNANVIDLVLCEGGNRVDHVVVSDYEGTKRDVRAGRFVLATGGLENPRLLLNANSQKPAGLGNDRGVVGRYFTDHLYTKTADFIFEDKAKAYIEQYPFGSTFKGRLKDQICSWDWLHSTVEDMRGKDMDCLSEIRHFFCPTPALMAEDRINNFSFRMQVRTPGHGESTDGKIFTGSGQAINPKSRVMLSDKTDRFGLRRIKLDWQLSETDKRTLRQGTIRFGETLAKTSIGRLRIVDWMVDEDFDFMGTGGHHHMCTTRMGDSPEVAVVDRNLKLFDVDNLYVAGSSSFATGGQANPTLTIVQLTLRLANHLNQG